MYTETIDSQKIKQVQSQFEDCDARFNLGSVSGKKDTIGFDNFAWTSFCPRHSQTTQ